MFKFIVYFIIKYTHNINSPLSSGIVGGVECLSEDELDSWNEVSCDVLSESWCFKGDFLRLKKLEIPVDSLMVVQLKLKL